ncbi:ubiquitin carboxyl-terminal hydrolase 40 [Stylonychia lemnae]|uniref:Ubiquitin carboxyl-terminal hydrolase 40 n=1 Tax=Stylonychia lemnae TaxID=5949 RepID=A0A078AQR6_STYLE|nr:ubiquitin carboxyl-terminal hydrolase 40 [Stylonychia lemnae]|eukprot:CDW84271.1 ubiquitin carboxyl-terminal hydrolase 40 [Stylonychia lemnae]
MIGLNEMFFEEGDQDIGTSQAVYSSSYKGLPFQFNIIFNSETQELCRKLRITTYAKAEKQIYSIPYTSAQISNISVAIMCKKFSIDVNYQDGDIETPSSFLSGKRREILFNIQKLFVLLQEEDSRAITTQELTKAFGWDNNEELQQQDVQELNRVLFDIVERSLKDTAYEALIDQLYRGNLSHLIICQKCNTPRVREEKFLDLLVQVKNCKDICESLQKFFAFDKLDGDNQLFCDHCNEKTDTLKGQRITKLPPILTICLARFDIDYTKWERIKVNDRFEYPLEIDLKDFVEPDALPLQADTVYELKSIIIHRGGAYGGHYYAYIQDELQEGDWHLQMPEQFSKEPKVVEKVKYDPKKFMTEEQIKAEEEAKLNQADAAITIDIETDNQENSNNNKQNKGGKGGKKQKGNNKQQQNQKKNQNKTNNQQQQQKKNEKKEIEVEYNYDECDFPIPYSDRRLINNWYDFNDSQVTPLLPGKLQSQFGGSSENAYMLVYRQRCISLDLALQQRPEHQDFFQIDPENYLVSYVEDSKFDEQGFRIRVKFTDTVQEVRDQIASQLGFSDFNAFEVERVRNGNCQLLQNWAILDPNAQLQDTKITHLSTWMIVKDEIAIKRLQQVSGENIQPIKLRLRFYGEEFEQKLYNNTTIADFLNIVESTTSIPVAQICLKVVEDTVIRRIDRQLKNADNPNILNTLRDLKIVDNAAILVEMKDESQVSQEEDEIKQSLSHALKDKDEVNVDDTENIRTVIVNLEYNESDFTRYQINIDWSLQQLNEFIVEQQKLEQPQRMRNLTTSRLFVKEELETQLRNYPDFQTGGARIQMEAGRYPSFQEIVIKAVVYKQEDILKQFYFPINNSVQECKEMMCKEFNIDPTKHTLYRIDHLEEPAFPLRREKQEIVKCHVSSGDLLIIKSDSILSAEEKLVLHIHMTMTGQSDDSQYIDKLEVHRDYTLKDLKDIVLSMPQFDFAKNYVIYDFYNILQNGDQIRVREKQSNMFFGKIFRDQNKSLKQLQITNNSQIVIQVLREPEELDPNTMILLISRRDVTLRTYSQQVEFKFKSQNGIPLIADLEKQCREFYQINDDESISIAKYFPHKFEWKKFDKEEEVVEKKKKGKQVTLKMAVQDLRKLPFFMKDGDIIGVRFESENADGQDDFQTETDKVLREEFMIRKEQERIEREKEQKSSQGKSKRQEGPGIYIRLEEDYPMAELFVDNKDDTKVEDQPEIEQLDSEQKTDDDAPLDKQE